MSGPVYSDPTKRARLSLFGEMTKVASKPGRTPVEDQHALQEKASKRHQSLLVSLYRVLRRAKWTEIRETRTIDLWGRRPDGVRTIFEAKTLTGKNELGQTRAAFAQVVEYREVYGAKGDKLCLVVDGRLSPERSAVLERLGVPAIALQPGTSKFVAVTPLARDLADSLAR